MNFNAASGARQPQTRGRNKFGKHVGDVNAIGPSIPTSQFIPSSFDPPQSTQPPPPLLSQQPTMQNQFIGSTSYMEFHDESQNQNFIYSQATIPNQSMPNNQFQNYSNIPTQQQQYQHPQQTMMPPSSQGFPNNSGGNFQQQFAVFQQPIVQDMAVQYGQKLADQGKQFVENNFEKYVPVTRLKYYFAVDNKYVMNKLRLLFFPFMHKDWSLKYDQDNPVQPRHDINAVDLYIPCMAYITYVVLAGLMLGMQKRFTPEQLGIQASSALAYSIFELILYSITLYVANIPTHLRTLDLLAFSGYKYVIIIACILISVLFQRFGYYIALAYCSLSMGLFLLRTLKTKVLNEVQQPTTSVGITYDAYGGLQNQNLDYNVGRKRKLYFLFLVVGFQVFLTFWLSKHLILS